MGIYPIVAASIPPYYTKPLQSPTMNTNVSKTVSQVAPEVVSPVVTRFAPSPTGYLHIGGARTALFNWAFARHHGGRFILRIEDTDQARSSRDSTQRILKELTWLGLDWDDGPDPTALDPYTMQKGVHGPYFQSQRLDHYRQQVDHWLESGQAYKCFKTPQELQALRQQAKAAKRPYKYDPTESRGLTHDQVTALESSGKPYVVRFHMPRQDITVDDLVLGKVTVRHDELEDFIILKSDGFPTFHLANVVDDALMGVTHVLRAQEHLMNTPKHVALQSAMGVKSPAYAHMPLIFNADGSKMSKRDKAKTSRQGANQWLTASDDRKRATLAELAHIELDSLTAFLDKKSDDQAVVAAIAESLQLPLPEIDVHDFRASGYLPGVILNYIALLGWSPGNEVEQFGPDPLAFLKENFDLSRVGKANARFDRDKLRAFNTDAIAALSPQSFRDRLREHGQQFHPRFEQHLDQHFERFADCTRERSRTIDEPFATGRFFIEPDEAIEYTPAAVKKVLLKNDSRGLAVLQDLQPLLQASESWSADGLESLIKNYAQATSMNLGQVAQPLRVAISGGTVSPPIFDTLLILGQRTTLARIEHCLKWVGQPQNSAQT